VTYLNLIYSHVSNPPHTLCPSILFTGSISSWNGVILNYLPFLPTHENQQLPPKLLWHWMGFQYCLEKFKPFPIWWLPWELASCKGSFICLQRRRRRNPGRNTWHRAPVPTSWYEISGYYKITVAFWHAHMVLLCILPAYWRKSRACKGILLQQEASLKISWIEIIRRPFQ
jgi:hypothetical protein